MPPPPHPSPWFHKLPQQGPRAPPGLEWWWWQRIPRLLFWGTALPLGLDALHHIWHWGDAAPATERWVLLVDYLTLGALTLHWTLVGTLALGCWVVRVMKGPAYVADPFPADPQQLGPAALGDQPPGAGNPPSNRF